MARTFGKGAEAVIAAATRTGGGAFTPTHQFEPGDTKFLQFLTPMEDVATVLMHRFIIIGEKENGDPKYADFISLRDPNLDGPDGYDQLIDRFSNTPAKRCIALAVELEPVYEKQGAKKVLAGWDLVMRQYEDAEGNAKEVPNVALVNESPFTFYGHLAAYSDLEPIENVVFAVKRTGKSTDTSYTLMRAGDAIEDLAEEPEVKEFFESFDFQEYLENLADEDRMRELIDPLPDDAVVNRFAKKGKKKKKDEDKPSGSTRTRRTKVAEPDPDPEEEEAEETADEPEAEAKPAAARSRRFSSLKKDMSKDEE